MNHPTIILDDGIAPIDTGVDLGGSLAELRRLLDGLPTITLKRILAQEPEPSYRINPVPALRAARQLVAEREADQERAQRRERAFEVGDQVKARRRWIML